MGKHYKREYPKRPILSVSVSLLTRTRIINYAEEHDLTISQVVRLFLDKELTKHGY